MPNVTTLKIHSRRYSSVAQSSSCNRHNYDYYYDGRNDRNNSDLIPIFPPVDIPVALPLSTIAMTPALVTCYV